MNNQIIVDTTTMMMVKLLRDTEAEEPTNPENIGGGAPFELAQELARKHNEWHQHMTATRLMLSMRLLDLAEDQLP